MKYLIKFNESINEVEIIDFLDDIFLELKDNNIDVVIKPMYNYTKFTPDKTKIIGFSIGISSENYFRLSDIYDDVMVAMDYMRSNNMFLKVFKSTNKINIDYFYDYMMGDEKDISIKDCLIKFNLKGI